MIKMKDLNDKIIQWAEDRGIFEKSSPIKQQRKTVEEMGELFEAVNKGNTDDIKMEIGDVYVTLVLQAKMNNAKIRDVSLIVRSAGIGIDSIPSNIGDITESLTDIDGASFSIESSIRSAMVSLAGAAIDNDLTIIECVQAAYDKISKRKGDMKDGIFIKDNEDKIESERVA